MHIHLIGNAHLDPVWLWQWAEGLAETRSTFRSALDRMTEDPDFIFTCGAAAIYQWIEETEPELFAEIRTRVQEGRWRVTGGWWIQADCNIPSGESFVRQALVAQRYFMDRFGVRCRCGYCVDSFGHCASLPKLLSGCGLEGWVWMRPGEHENPNIPKPYFFWEAEDGSRVVALRISDQAYTCWDVPTLDKRIQTLVKLYADSDTRELMCFYGVGDHGGGPTKAQLAAIRQWRGRQDMPALEHSFPEKVLDAVACDKLPVYRGELQHHASGCYAAVSAIKALNRRAETALVTAEAWTVAARLLTGWQPGSAALESAWKDLLFNQFHDILAGTSLPEAYDDAAAQIGSAIHTAETRRHMAQQRISWRIDTRGDGSPLVVFNNSTTPFRGIVETADFTVRSPGTGGAFVDAQGDPVPWQEVPPHSVTSRRRALLELSIPPLGRRLLRMVAGAEPTPPLSPPVVTHKNELENALIRLWLGPNGTLCLTDKRTGHRVLRAPSGRARVLRDDSDTWSHGVFRFDDVEGDFRFESMRVVEAGPLRGRIRLVFRYDRSTLRLDYTLGAGEAFVAVDGEIDWHGCRRIVKLIFAAPNASPSHTAEIPYGTLLRPNSGNEEPMQRWVDLSGAETGITVINDCKYSYDVRNGTVRVTLLRSPYFAHHIPAEPDPALEPVITDQGVQRFRLRLVPHAGDWRTADIPALAGQLHAPPNTLAEGIHAGAGLAPDNGLIECTAANVDIGAIKPAEEENAIIVRAIEMAGVPIQAAFRVPALSLAWEADFSPGQIKTFFIPLAENPTVREVNLLEEGGTE